MQLRPLLLISNSMKGILRSKFIRATARSKLVCFIFLIIKIRENSMNRNKQINKDAGILKIYVDDQNQLSVQHQPTLRELQNWKIVRNH